MEFASAYACPERVEDATEKTGRNRSRQIKKAFVLFLITMSILSKIGLTIYRSDKIRQKNNGYDIAL